MRLCFGHQTWKPTQQIRQRDEQVGLRRHWQIHIYPTRYRQIVKTQSLHALNEKEHQVLSEDQDHSFVVAKCTIRSGDRAKLLLWPMSVLKNYRGSIKGSEVDMEVNTRFGSSSSTATFEPAIECATSDNARPKIDTPHSNHLQSQGHQRQPLAFTTVEDVFFKERYQ